MIRYCIRCGLRMCLCGGDPPICCDCRWMDEDMLPGAEGGGQSTPSEGSVP